MVSVATAVVTAVADLGDRIRAAASLSPAVLPSGWRDLNPRPLDPQSSALPNCATARPPSRDHAGRFGALKLYLTPHLVPGERFEPVRAHLPESRSTTGANVSLARSDTT